MFIKLLLLCERVCVCVCMYVVIKQNGRTPHVTKLLYIILYSMYVVAIIYSHTCHVTIECFIIGSRGKSSNSKHLWNFRKPNTDPPH